MVDRALQSTLFSDLEEIEGTYELESRKAHVNITRLFQINITVYQLAKLGMLEFYYGFLDQYLNHHNFELIQMDINSNYIIISANWLEDIIWPDQREEFEAKKERVACMGQVERAHARTFQTRMRRQLDDRARSAIL